MANPEKVMVVIKSSRPLFRNNHDKVAFVVHAFFVASGFKLVAIGRPALAQDAFASSPTQGEVGIEEWNESDEYAFVYVNPKRGSEKVLVKCLAVDDKLVVSAIAEGGTEPAHLKIRVKKYVAESREEGDYDVQFKNLDRLIVKLLTQILYKLDKGRKPVTCTTRISSKRNKEPEPPYYAQRPLPVGPQFHHPTGVVVVDRPDYSDLIPGLAARIFPVVRDGFGNGSMLVGPHDLRMFPRFGDQLGFMRPPQPSVPLPSHGVRYDPIGTGSAPGRQSQSSRGDIEHFPCRFESDYM